MKIPVIAEVHTHILYVAHNHDEWPWFRLWFTVATVAASIILNLGIFVALVALHMCLDIIKYRTKHSLTWHWTIIETLREGLVDVFFIALGLLLGVAFHYSVAIGGLGRLAELEVLLLNLVLRVGPRLKIAEHLLEVLLYWKQHFATLSAPLTPLTAGEKRLLVATCTCLAAIGVLPFVTSITWNDILISMQQELTPKLELGIAKTISALRT